MRGVAVWMALSALVACGEEDAPPPAVRMAEAEEATPPPVVPVPVGERPEPGPGGTGERTPTPCPETTGGGPREVTVAWSDVRSTRSCFFFSGPGRLGRDDRLGERARLELREGRVVLDFGGGVRFTGSAGESIALTRASEHAFEGTWRVIERITGAWQPGTERHLDSPCSETPRVAVARYQYEECDSASPAACPGPCTITATMTIR